MSDGKSKANAILRVVLRKPRLKIAKKYNTPVKMINKESAAHPAETDMRSRFCTLFRQASFFANVFSLVDFRLSVEY